jgi:Flp pilus assembly protein TadG
MAMKHQASQSRPMLSRIVRLGDERGQAMVEFALIAPVLLLLVIGVVEFGRAWNAYQVVTDAAREGARVAVVNNLNGATVADSLARVTVRNALGRAGLAANTATITLSGMGGATGTSATVSIDYPYTFRFLAPLMKWTAADASITLKTSFVMRNEAR